MHQNDLAMTAHLMRRAGFGSTREELASRPYEDLVDDLVHPERLPEVDADVLQRYYVGEGVYVGTWMYRMVATKRPLEEKMAFFWHHVFATGNSKVDNDNHLTIQVQMFREHGMGNFRDLLLRVALNPAMIYWLDNNENHKRAPHEN